MLQSSSKKLIIIIKVHIKTQIWIFQSSRRDSVEKNLTVSMGMQIQSLTSLNELRIWRCRELLCRLQTWLGSGIAVAVV